MQDFRRARRGLLVVIQSAMAIEATAEALDALIGLARLYVKHDKKGEAAGLLAFALHHPDTPEDSRHQALDLFLDLETELCPRVILDANVRAREIKLEQVVEEVLADEA